MIPIFAQMNGLQYAGITELPDHQPDVDALLAAKPRILYLCTPNNPTGCATVAGHAGVRGARGPGRGVR
jgi:histidinol-phosphate/aromatic aminotransferase/cobyric acid decarboxylase-like protein